LFARIGRAQPHILQRMQENTLVAVRDASAARDVQSDGAVFSRHCEGGCRVWR